MCQVLQIFKRSQKSGFEKLAMQIKQTFQSDLTRGPPVCNSWSSPKSSFDVWENRLVLFLVSFQFGLPQRGGRVVVEFSFAFFFLGFEFFNVIYWVQMFKGKFANSLMQHSLCGTAQTPITTVGQPQLQALSWSCLQLPHSRVCSLPRHPAAPSDYRMVMYKVLASGTNSGQLCRAMPASELRMELAQGFLWLHHSSAPLCAQSYLPYRCGSQSGSQYTSSTVALPLSLLPKNLVCNTKHIRTSVKITSSVKVQTCEVKSENNFLLRENVFCCLSFVMVLLVFENHTIADASHFMPPTSDLSSAVVGSSGSLDSPGAHRAPPQVWATPLSAFRLGAFSDLQRFIGPLKVESGKVGKFLSTRTTKQEITAAISRPSSKSPPREPPRSP